MLIFQSHIAFCTQLRDSYFRALFLSIIFTSKTTGDVNLSPHYHTQNSRNCKIDYKAAYWQIIDDLFLLLFVAKLMNSITKYLMYITYFFHTLQSKLLKISSFSSKYAPFLYIQAPFFTNNTSMCNFRIEIMFANGSFQNKLLSFGRPNLTYDFVFSAIRHDIANLAASSTSQGKSKSDYDIFVLRNVNTFCHQVCH